MGFQFIFFLVCQTHSFHRLTHTAIDLAFVSSLCGVYLTFLYEPYGVMAKEERANLIF